MAVIYGHCGLPLRLVRLIRASWLIRWTGVPPINRITRIHHAKRSTFSANGIRRYA